MTSCTSAWLLVRLPALASTIPHPKQHDPKFAAPRGCDVGIMKRRKS
jgi:hypothetical protein